MKDIETLVERVKALRGTRLRAVLEDGGEAVVSPADAVTLLQGPPVVRFEPLGDMRGQARLLDLLNGLCGGLDGDQAF